MTIYEFLRSPGLWISIFICAAGVTVQLYRLLRASGKKDRLPATQSAERITRSSKLGRYFNHITTGKPTVLETQPLTALLSLVFHLCLILTPLFVQAHNILLYESWNFRFWSAPERTSDMLTLTVFFCGIVLMARRIVLSNVRAISTFYDYFLLAVSTAPFLTGLMAHYQVCDYEIMMTAHILSGEVLIAALGITKLGHMVFFFFARIFIGSEYSFTAGSRKWRMQVQKR